MTRPVDEAVYREPGSSRWPLLWGPVFALIGYLFEVFSVGQPHAVAWGLIGVGLLLLTMLWVYARRRFLSVYVTKTHLWQGQESLAVDQIVDIDDPQGELPDDL